MKQSSTKKLKLFKRKWVKISDAKKTKQLGIKDEQMIVESELLKTGAESNPGPPSERANKLPRYQKWNRELSLWLIPYLKRCESTLSARTHLLSSFMDPTAAGTSGIFPMICQTMGLSAAELMRDFFANQSDVTQDILDASIDTYRWRVIECQLDSMLPTLSAEQTEGILQKLEKKKNENLVEFVNRFNVTASTFDSTQLSEPRKAKILF